jgi:tetratricopeptide (TPR) repeat protein
MLFTRDKRAGTAGDNEVGHLGVDFFAGRWELVVVGRGGGRWQPSPTMIVALAAAFALVGNLATNTVQVSGRWWRVVVWAGAGLLLALSVVVELVRHRGAAAADGVGGRRLPASRVVGMIPRLANHFQDRSRETDALRRALGGNGHTALVALPGARGAGKTQLAAAHARRCDAQGYDLVVWINAESGPVSGLAELARRRGLGSADDAPEQLALAAVNLLESDDRTRRLVVFDNVEDPDALAGFLPSRGTTKVIITSNRQEFTAMPGITAVPVGMFTEAEGRRFLYEATGLPDSTDTVEVGRCSGWLASAGSGPSRRLRSRNNLGYAYRAAGQLDEAIDLFQIAVVERERILGPGSPHTLDTWSNLAGAYQAAGRLDEAIALYESTLAAREWVLGIEHPDTLESRNYLAGSYRAAGRLDESIGLYEKVYAVRERILSPGHPLTTGVRVSLNDAVKERDGPH